MSALSPAAARPRLLTGPAGSGKTHAALDRIRTAATAPGSRGRRAGAPGEALLVLPTYAQVMHVKRLALSRWDVRGILDDPFTTFTAAGERFLPGFRVRGLPSAEERDRLMEEALRRCDVPLFREIADRAGFRAHVLRLVKELKQTGLPGEVARARMRAADADEDSGHPGGRLSGVARARMLAFLEVFEAYEALLQEARLEDHEDALRRLAEALREEGAHAIRPPRVLVVDGFDDFTAVEEQILLRLADAVLAAGGEVLVTLPWDEARPLLFENSAGTRARLVQHGFLEERLDGFARSRSVPLARLAAGLFGPPREVVPGGAEVQALVAGDLEDEAETIARTLRRVVRGGEVEGVRGWRDVGVVVRVVDDYAPRLQGACARVGVPLRVIGAGEPLAGEPLLRALRGPLAVLAGRTAAGRFEASGLMEWLRWRVLAGVDPVSVSDVDDWDMAQRAQGPPAEFDAFRAAAPESVRPILEELAAVAEQLAAAADPGQVYDGLAAAVVSLVPLPVASGFDADGRPRSAEHDERVAHAGAARARVVSILGGLRRAVERTGLGGAPSVQAAVHELGDAVERTPLRLPDRRLDAVTLMDAEEARFWELPLVVVAGLEEGRFPLRPREDLLLRDADRRILRENEGSLRLPLAREREVRERRLFYGAVTRASRRLYLSRRAYDDKGDPKPPSFFLTELESVVVPEKAVEARTPGRVARAADECFSATDWRLFAAGRLAPWATRRGDVPAADRTLARALQAESGTPMPGRVAHARRRAADPLWADDARRSEVLARFRACTAHVSVSRLNHAVLCPHRFFLAYVAEIARDELTLDGPAFDFLQQGKALHFAFEEALRRPDASVAELARAGVEHVNGAGLDARLLQAELERAVALLRDREEKTRGPLVPWIEGLEFDFYAPEKAVDLGPADCRFALGGYIDRIDRTPQGRASILDYKRSAAAADSAHKKGRDGVDLQLPLYARALEAMRVAEGEELEVVGLEWVAGLTRSRRVIHDADAAPLFAPRKEKNKLEGEPHDEFRARLTDAEATATDAVRAARAGAHERAPADAGVCSDCPWERVCRPDTAWIEARAAEEAGEADA